MLTIAGFFSGRRTFLAFAARLLVGLISASCFLRPVSVAAESCSSALLRNADSGSGYPYAKQSDGRCEGRYARDNAGIGGLMVASLISGALEFDPKSIVQVRLRWKAPKGKTIHISAYSLVHRTHYQMDIEVLSDSGQYSWPMNVLSRVPLASSEIGVVAYYTEQFGSARYSVYVPLALEQAVAAGAVPYKLVLIPPIELSRVALSVTRVDNDGGIANTLFENKVLPRRYFPAEWPALVDLPLTGVPEGIYRLSLSADLGPGGSTSADVLVYLNPALKDKEHAPPPKSKDKIH